MKEGAQTAQSLNFHYQVPISRDSGSSFEVLFHSPRKMEARPMTYLSNDAQTLWRDGTKPELRCEFVFVALRTALHLDRSDIPSA